MGDRGRTRESAWGVGGLSLTLVPAAVVQGLGTLGGPWPGDAGMQVVGWGLGAALVAFPLGLICAIIGLCHRGRGHFASLAAFAIPVAFCAGISGRDPSGASTVAIVGGAVYLAALGLATAIRA